ncbi:hypothetical protein Lalb_Chr01g0010371 [Lupinus albus]|uniref:Uncharacterized protein n=1 Tax=Lupinus albus TaxID=3870 RepID=A0A6A4R4X6_LUPAL|nr:hypothetical protein Lalb_Chr01g0010371 [Lupinus albus]
MYTTLPLPVKRLFPGFEPMTSRSQGKQPKGYEVRGAAEGCDSLEKMALKETIDFLSSLRNDSASSKGGKRSNVDSSPASGRSLSWKV